MITTDNYFDEIGKISLAEMPEAIRKGYEFVLKATANGSSWNAYHTSEPIKKTIDLYLVKLNELRGKDEKGGRAALFIQKGADEKPNPRHKAIPKIPKSSKPPAEEPLWVERMPEELRFIRRFANLDGKTKAKEDVLRFINSLQKAILEKRIRRSSPYAEQIKFIQTRLIEVYNSMKAKIKFELKPDTREALMKIAGGEKVLASVGYIKRYIAMNEKPGMKEKARQLLEQINKAMLKGKITDSDPYIVEIHDLKKNLKAFSTDKSIKTLQIEPATLNGLEGILGCACPNLNGVPGRPAIMNSMDFADLEFQTIGLKGKWFDLIGDPSSNFTAMVFGKPKMGKSYLCIDFAGYLARNHGKVLYVAKEEGLDLTLQKKLNDKAVAHPNLFVSSVLPALLEGYDFIFLDSVTKLGLQPEDLTRLKGKNPSKSFIFIFQTTKQGAFRGTNAFQHDVDVVIEVPQRGKAVQFGRFNQGGEISIF
ncbi:hypothetical protein [Flaviaesturariibacter aridisoli]|uniref:AAA+ ATPase domain-containing protein n=1 Tax=Flaviaesturariibacter aridisoli TaxID=2545761 RepID=A0A4R4E183_9BACT|nr:hypothetical protein [Flaviaesturariibacter aridisoli]TCZ68344.1 hypothetical protein E0486_14225 [Flaviaesturariibacter aridisoli]